MSSQQPAVATPELAIPGGNSRSHITDLVGTVKWFDPRKGFGFIVGPDAQDIFVHYSVIDQASGFRTLKDGEEVIYSAHEGDKGWTAKSVRAVRSGANLKPMPSEAVPTARAPKPDSVKPNPAKTSTVKSGPRPAPSGRRPDA